MTVKGEGQVHFGWVLKGASIQDVWTGHVRNPPPGFPSEGFGTTLRFYNPKSDAWECVWVAPLEQLIQKLIAKKEGDEIVLETQTKEGYPERWIYSEITSSSFHWHSEESHDGAKAWVTTQGIFARRVALEK